MFIKGKGFYLALPLLVVVLAKMLHPILYVFLIFYFIFMYLKHFKILLSVSLLLSFLLFLFFYLPQPLNQNEISGKVVSKDDQSIVVKRGYHKVKVYGEFKNISLFDDISLIGKPYNFHQIQNDYAFNYQYYLYSLNIFDTLQLEKIKSNQHQDHLYHYLEKRIKTSSKVKSLLSLFILGTKDEQMKEYYQKLTQLSIVHLFALSGVKTLKLDIPLVPETRIKWALMPLHIAKIYILKLCLDEEIIPRCRFPCSRGYLTKCINQQKKQ